MRETKGGFEVSKMGIEIAISSLKMVMSQLDVLRRENLTADEREEIVSVASEIIQGHLDEKEMLLEKLYGAS